MYRFGVKFLEYGYHSLCIPVLSSAMRGGFFPVGPVTANLPVEVETTPAFARGMSKSQKSNRMAQMSCRTLTELDSKVHFFVGFFESQDLCSCCI